MTVKLSTQTNPTQRQGTFPASPFRLFEDFFNDWALKTAQTRTSDDLRPAVDVIEKNGNIVLRAEVPGLSEQDLDLRIEGSVLTIRGERKQEPEAEGYAYHQVEGFYGTFSRSFTLPQSADVTQIDATCRNGVLTVTIPQKPETQPRTIKVAAR